MRPLVSVLQTAGAVLGRVPGLRHLLVLVLALPQLVELPGSNCSDHRDHNRPVGDHELYESDELRNNVRHVFRSSWFSGSGNAKVLQFTLYHTYAYFVNSHKRNGV